MVEDLATRIRRWVEHDQAHSQGRDTFRITQLAKGIGVTEFPLSSQTVHHLSHHLRDMGCFPTRRYIAGRQQRVWFHPV